MNNYVISKKMIIMGNTEQIRKTQGDKDQGNIFKIMQWKINTMNICKYVTGDLNPFHTEKKGN